MTEIFNMDGEKKRDHITALGTGFMVFGVAVWGVYAVVNWGLGWDVTGRQFLPYHLAGVIPGTILRRRKFFAWVVKKIK